MTVKYVKCAKCGADTDVEVDAPHGGIFYCAAHTQRSELATGTGSGRLPDGYVWTRSAYQAKLDEGKQ